MLRRTVLLGLLAAALVPASAQAAVTLVKVGTFDHPVSIAAPPNDTHRLFVVEQPGRIREVIDGVVQPTPFLDISSEVSGPSHYPADPEQGMLSMAFAPDYPTSHRFFVYYTDTHCPSEPGCDNVVAEFTADTPDHASASSEVRLITMPHPSEPNHNGGQLQFGPRGDLFISTGDGGGSNDTEGNAQNTTNLLGKILRITPGPTSYTIPPDNPFAGNTECPGGQSADQCPEIYAYGLRNPWRFSFDRQTGDLVIGDVGQSNWEEIDFAHVGQDIGANYGWPCFEGTHAGSPAQGATECPPSLTLGDTVQPVWQYSHSCSTTPFCGAGIIGGYVVRDPSLPELYGRYVYGDLSSSASKGLRSIVLGQPSATDDQPVPVNVAGLSGFGEDAFGCVYAASVSNGGVWRLAEAGSTSPGPCPVSSGPPPPSGRDTTPAKLKITRQRNQHVLKTHYVKIVVVPNEVATITARGTVSIPKSARVYRLHTTSRLTLGHKKVVLRLRISKKTLSRIRHALRHRKFLTARITVTSKDASGNLSKAKHTTVRLVR
jgi:glucose/arabinose dehydrogenase